MFERLIEYKAIGWDFDDTLVKHRLSEDFWRFIRENPYGQTHYIVTMRTHGWEKRVFDELAEHGAELDAAHFVKVINPPNGLWESHQKAMMSGELQIDHPYHLFKGEQCGALGIDVLIDDMEHGRLPSEGCTRAGVHHINPDDL
jgi:FMN phosphatase YigB (HAD superfamily)